MLVNCFTSTEMFFFYIFFETMLMPMYMLMGVWGSQSNKIFAANQFFLYTLFGSFFMLIAMTILYTIFGTTNLFLLKSFILESSLENLMFVLFFVSFSVKVPMFPFHLWLPKAHVEAPTVGSVLLAGVLLKLGSYGFLRYSLFLFPNASIYFAPMIIAICVISVVFSSLTTVSQMDLKSMIAYSSMAHMNYLMAGLFSNSLLGMAGSLLLQMAHGLSSSALFLCVGFLYERHKTSNIFYYSGLVTLMPLFVFFFFMFSLANLGFPGTVNFISELLLFVGLLETNFFSAMLMLVGMFFSAMYSFLLVSSLCFGPHSLHMSGSSDLTSSEFLILLPLFLLVIYLGIFPNKLLMFWKLIIETWYIHM